MKSFVFTLLSTLIGMGIGCFAVSGFPCAADPVAPRNATEEYISYRYPKWCPDAGQIVCEVTVWYDEPQIYRPKPDA